MACCNNEPSKHTCRCQQAAPALSVAGLALQSEAPSVVPALREAFPLSAPGSSTFMATGDDFIARVHAFLEPFSTLERDSIRAVAIGPNGDFDPWASAPVEKLLKVCQTPWLPDLLNDESTLRFHMQPIVYADTLDVHGFESLVRVDESFGPHRPDEIIDASKAHDALLKFDQIARRNAILSCYPKLQGNEKLFINFFPTTVYDPKVCLRTTMQAAADINADLSRLVFEVVESEQFPGMDHLRHVLDEYRRAGAKVALDDLGSGNTSMVFIEQLKPDYIKIDKQILKDAVETQRYSMLKGLVAFAHENNIQVIAEGVETAFEYDLVNSLGVDFIQGWLIAKASEQPRRHFDTTWRSNAA